MRLGLIVGSSPLPWELAWTPVGEGSTPYGEAAMIPELAARQGVEIVRLARHGIPHRFAPHAVNYRANLHALKAAGVQAIVALNTVGGINPRAAAGSLHLPEQIIDYTWGRAQTFSADDAVVHVDFSEPYDGGLRAGLAEAAARAGLTVTAGGVMGVTQGPRLETAAEIRRMARDGCDLVGMTGMPEAVLARELALPLAALCLVVNPAAGVGPEAAAVSLDEIREVGRVGMRSVAALLDAFLERLE
jgi:5'-methylthioinosine phosphorylase